MDNKIIFIVTLKGEGEIKNHTHHLSGDIKRVLSLVDDVSTVERIMKRAAPSLHAGLPDMLQELVDGGFIQDKNNAANMPKMATPKLPTTLAVMSKISRGKLPPLVSHRQRLSAPASAAAARVCKA